MGNIIKTVFISLCLLILNSCDEPKPLQVDKEKHEELFFKCLSSVPWATRRGDYNNWSAVVDSCYATTKGLAERKAKEKK